MKTYMKLFVINLIFLIMPFFSVADDGVSELPELPKTIETSRFLQNPLINSINKLESDRDPKCHATATRLEGLIYGTPLSDNARYRKVELQKLLTFEIWLRASKQHPNTEVLTMENVKPAVHSLFSTLLSEQGWLVATPHKEIVIDARDKEHYGSIAYSFRAMLALQQDLMLTTDIELPLLSEDAIEFIRTQIDLVTLSLLKESDNIARLNDEFEITDTILLQGWQALFPSLTLIEKTFSVSTYTNSKGGELNAVGGTTGVLQQLIESKIESFQKYNDINNTLFSRNLQVYFAKLSLPKNSGKSAKFTQYFTEAMVVFAGDLYLEAQAVSADTANVVKESDVAIAVNLLLPHNVNEFEDVIFFADYPIEQQIKIESYDMDSFRDSGLHWFYLQEAVKDLGERISIEADPFAAELLTEAIAHYGVLLLRTAGEEGRAVAAVELDANFITLAHLKLAKQVTDYLAFKPIKLKPQNIQSAVGQQTISTNYFNDVTSSQNIDIEHRSSDWLSRQLRSYLNKSQNVGIITIPPAFGGAGVAAEDVNGDGLPDLLILSGAGNKLYFNIDGKFVDVTEPSGLKNNSQRFPFRVNAALPGEPRQPLIADLDNDGDQDIVITYVDEKHRIYSNDGNGGFVEKTSVSLLGGDGKVGGPATILDVNNDGLLDIYIEYFGNYLQGDLPTLKRKNDNGGENELFINKGNFVFEKAPKALGANNAGWGQAVTHTDLNMDGWQDLIVGNDFGVNSYYINQQGKGFVDYADKLGTGKPSYTMSIGLSDLNQDGIADIYISNIVTMNKDQKYVLPSENTQAEFNPDKLANMRVVEGNDLFLSSKSNQGVIQYQVSDKVGRGYSSTGWAWDADFFDADNDGDDDLYVLNGMNDYYVYSRDNPYYADPNTGDQVNAYFPDASKAKNVFFLNTDGALHNMSEQSGLDFIANSRSAAYLDFDNDGDLDVIVNNYHGKAQLFENNADTLDNNWIKLRLVGDPSKGVNLDAIGAQVLVGFGEKGYGWHQVSGSQGYMSVHPKEQLFGLGKDNSARVMVIWPNGKRQRFGPLQANHRYTLTYGAAKP